MSSVDRFDADRGPFFGAIVLSDISGFTKLAEALATGLYAERHACHACSCIITFIFIHITCRGDAMRCDVSNV